MQLSLFSKPAHSQAEAILHDLQAGIRLTSLDALQRHNCFRLAARINELRNKGYDIKTVNVSDPMTNKNYAQYEMGE